MSARNDITGEPIQSKAFTAQGRENYERIFRKIPISNDTWTADSPMTRKQYVDRYHPDTVKLRDHSKHSKKKKR
jgi:hypothetical protein